MGAVEILRKRSEVVALAAVVLVIIALPGSIPLGVLALGVVTGCVLALQSLGIVLVYRSNRIINFAQGALGGWGAYLFYLLVVGRLFPRLLERVCSSCEVGTGMLVASYWLSLVLVLALVVGGSALVYVLIIKRFADAPRLVLTIGTIAVAQFLVWATSKLQRPLNSLLGPAGRRAVTESIGRPVAFPWRVRFVIEPITFRAADVLTVVVTVIAVVAIYLFLRFSRIGIALRASSENPERAATLGINVTSVTSAVWVLAGLLSALAAISVTTRNGATAGAAGADLLVRMLAAAVVARFASLPVAVVASVVLGVLDSSVFFVFGNRTAVDAVLLGIILFALMLQRRQSESRAEIEQASAWRAAREIRPIPRELRNLPAVKTWKRNGRIMLALLMGGTPFVVSPSQVTQISVVMIYAIVAMSLLILSGWGGQISLGQFAFAAIGAYVAAVLTKATGLPFLLSILIGGVAGAGAAALVGIPALKLRGLHLAITSLAFAQFTTSVLLNRSYLGKALPDRINRPVVFGVDLGSSRVFYFFVLLILALVVVAVAGLRRSPMARMLIAARDNEQNAQAFGVRILNLRVGAFMISGFMCGIAGGLFALSQFGISSAAFSPSVSVLIFLMAIIGGLGSVSGPLIGAAFIAFVRVFAQDELVTALLTGAGVLGLLLLMPGGLGEGFFSIRDAALRRLALRHRIGVPSLIREVEGGEMPRAAIAPKSRPGGGEVFVPARYRLTEVSSDGDG